MNTDSQSQKRRPYDNSLRQEQAQQTRRRILDSAIRAMAEGGPEGATLAQVARAAGVSEPTLYRHFGSREKLFEELDAHAQATLGLPGIPKEAELLPRHAARLFRTFGEHTELLRAVSRGGFGKEMRGRGRARRARQLKQLIAEHAPHLDERNLALVTGVVRVLVSWESFEAFTTDLGLTADEAGRAVEWAGEVLLAALAAGAEPRSWPEAEPSTPNNADDQESTP